MGYVESNLFPGERVLHRAELHWIMLLGPLVWVLLLVGSGVALVVAGRPELGRILGLAGVLATFLLVARAIHRNSTEMAVTNRRVVAKTGVLSRRTIEMNISKVENVGVDQGIASRAIGDGTVNVIGTGGTRERFAHIGNPMKFKFGVQAQSHDEHGAAPRRQSRRASDPELIEESATRITVRTLDGRTKSYRLNPGKPSDLQKAIAKLQAKGCSVVNIEAET